MSPLANHNSREMEKEDRETPDLPKWVIGVVVVSRMVYSAVTALGIVSVVWYYINGEWFPELIGDPVGTVVWVAILAVVGFVVIGAGFWLWVALSWLTGALVYKPLRDDMREVVRDEEV